MLAALSAALLLVPGGARLGPVLLGLDLALVLLVGFDWLRTPAPARLTVVRRLPRRAGLGAELERVVSVVAGPAAGRVLELREEFPASFEVTGRTDLVSHAALDGELPARALAPPVPGDPTGGPDRARLPREPARELSFTRRYRAGRRGEARLGALRLRLASPLGLVWRQAELPGSQPVSVEPALSGLRRTLRLAASERWRDLGVRSLRQRGASSDFESLREYALGDDPRLVDWKATARRGRPTVRQFQVERGQELVLVVDCGRRMQATSGPASTKLDHALDAALVLAAVALQEGDRVGIVAHDARVRAFVPPIRGPLAFGRLVDAVSALQPSPRESDLDRALAELAIRHRRRATLVVLSDVADLLSIGPQRAALARAARAHRVVFAALDDPDLRAVAAGSEPPGPHATPLRAAALGELDDRQSALRQLAASGARVLSPLPAEAAGPLLTAWLDERRSAR